MSLDIAINVLREPGKAKIFNKDCHHHVVPLEACKLDTNKNTDIVDLVNLREKTLVIGHQFAKFAMFSPANVFRYMV